MRLPDPKRSHAVLIGTGLYADEKLADLPVVGRTIGDLAAAITDPVYGIIARDHCSVLEDEGDIRLIGRQLRSAASLAEDLLLVYFVGHGLLDPRRHELYLGLPDSEWAEPEFNSLEYDKLRSSVLDSQSATKVIILDCCFSGRAATEAMADPVTEIVGQLEVDGTYVLASAGRDQVSLILPGEERTAFTGRFLQMISNGVPGGPEFLTIDYLFRQLVVTMKSAGLPQPRKLGTSTADMLALAANRAPERQHALKATATNTRGSASVTDLIAGVGQVAEVPAVSHRISQPSKPTMLAKASGRVISESERRFHQAMIGIYETAKRELGYNAARFIQMVSGQGGLAAARQLLWSDQPSEGFTTLWSHHRLDLTVEAHVLRDEFADLFTEDDRQRAQDRLDRFGWTGDRNHSG